MLIESGNLAQDKQFREPSLEYLRRHGYDAEWIGTPVDIKATREGKEYWIEMKGTEIPEDGVYFGAATLTEWLCAAENMENFYFLISNKPNGVESDSEWEFELVAPEDFMPYSTIPPFKINFNWPLNNTDRRPPINQRPTTIVPTWKILKSLQEAFDSQRNASSEEE